MAYNADHLTKLAALKSLAEKIKQGYVTKQEHTALSDKVDGLVTAGGEPNKIEVIKVNGAVQQITEKAVNITVPTKVGDLSDGSNYSTTTQMNQAIQAAIAETGHATFEKADKVPDKETAKENVLYLVMNSKTKHYDIYAKVEGDSGPEVVLLDDTTVDLTEYSTTDQIDNLLQGYVTKDGNKVLSANDYTNEDKQKLAGLENYTHPASANGGSKTIDLYKIATDANGHVSEVTKVVKKDITALGIPEQDTTYVDVVADGASGLMTGADKTKLDGMVTATDEEVTAMLAEVFDVE